MAKKKKQYKVGTRNQELKSIAKPLIKMIITIQNEEMQKGKKGKKPSFVWASLELSKRVSK